MPISIFNFGLPTKLVSIAILGILVLGLVVCSLAVQHVFSPVHSSSGLCSVETLINNLRFSSREPVEFTFILLASLLAFFALPQLRPLTVPAPAPLPTWFFWLHNQEKTRRNYILLAIQQGRLQPRFH